MMEEKSRNTWIMQYGLGIGIIQVVTFLSYIASIHWQEMGFLYLLFLLLMPVSLFRIVYNYVKKNIEEFNTFFSVFFFSFKIIIYATLFLGTIVYIYFSFFDGGALALYYQKLLEEPSISMGLKTLFPQQNLKEIFQQFFSQSPIDYLYNISITNLWFGSLLSFFIALIAKLSLKKYFVTNKKDL